MTSCYSMTYQLGVMFNELFSQTNQMKIGNQKNKCFTNLIFKKSFKYILNGIDNKKVCFQLKSDQMTVHFIVCLSKKMIKEFIF